MELAAQDNLLQQPVQVSNVAQLRRSGEVEENEEQIYLLLSTWTAYSPKCVSSDNSLTVVSSQQLPGVLSFSQVRDLEQAMATSCSDNPSDDQILQGNPNM
jgi:hypothetical protein